MNADQYLNSLKKNWLSDSPVEKFKKFVELCMIEDSDAEFKTMNNEKVSLYQFYQEIIDLNLDQEFSKIKNSISDAFESDPSTSDYKCIEIWMPQDSKIFIRAYNTIFTDYSNEFVDEDEYMESEDPFDLCSIENLEVLRIRDKFFKLHSELSDLELKTNNLDSAIGSYFDLWVPYAFVCLGVINSVDTLPKDRILKSNELIQFTILPGNEEVYFIGNFNKSGYTPPFKFVDFD